MSLRFLAAAAALSLLAGVSPAQADDPTPAGTGALDLKATLTRALEGTQTPALAALQMRDGQVVQEDVVGVRRNDGNDPALIDDVWLIGSDAKPMTATLLAKLVDRGSLSWDAPLSRLLPELKAGMNPAYRQVTLKQLLSHRAGLPHDVSDLKFFGTFNTDARPMPQQRLDYISRALKEKPIAKPGTKFSYSNTGFMIAAVVAERITGTSYEELMRREVFEPLGMASVGFGVTHEGQPAGHVGGKPVSNPDDSNPTMFAPAGNMHMSMRDWARFCLDQLAGARGQGKLLKPASYQMLQSPVSSDSGGLGWGVQASLAGRKGPVLVHAGSDGNWYALVALFPATGLGVLAAANAGEAMGGDKAARAAVIGLLPPVDSK